MQQLFCPQPDGAAAALLLVLTENVESWGSSLRVWQLGHSAFCSPKRMVSNYVRTVRSGTRKSALQLQSISRKG